MITAKGRNGQVTFDGNFVTIDRKGGFARITVGKGNKRIPITSITAVQWKPPGGVVNGFIQFTVAGGIERRSRLGAQTLDAANDENSVIVTKSQAAEFEALRAAVEDALVQRHQPQVAVAPQASKLDQLKQLGELRDSGVLSQDEFESEKARIMAGNEGAAVGTSTTPSQPPATPVAERPVTTQTDTDEEPRRSNAPAKTKGSGAAKAKRVGAAWATAGLSEAARAATKRKQAKG